MGLFIGIVVLLVIILVVKSKKKKNSNSSPSEKKCKEYTLYPDWTIGTFSSSQFEDSTYVACPLGRIFRIDIVQPKEYFNHTIDRSASCQGQKIVYNTVEYEYGAWTFDARDGRVVLSKDIEGWTKVEKLIRMSKDYIVFYLLKGNIDQGMGECIYVKLMKQEADYSNKFYISAIKIEGKFEIRKEGKIQNFYIDENNIDSYEPDFSAEGVGSFEVNRR